MFRIPDQCFFFNFIVNVVYNFPFKEIGPCRPSLAVLVSSRTVSRRTSGHASTLFLLRPLEASSSSCLQDGPIVLFFLSI
jgi:hypothetical protein